MLGDEPIILNQFEGASMHHRNLAFHANYVIILK